MASTNFAYFYFYSLIRKIYIKSKDQTGSLGTATEFIIGAIAGAAAQILTLPVAVITTRQQTQGEGEKKGILETAQDVVYSVDGWTGLWRGLKASLVLTVNPAITYGAYQRLREIVFPKKANLRPSEAFCKHYYHTKELI